MGKQQRNADGVNRQIERKVRRKARLKLFVFTEFCPDYTSGLAFAIAKDETEARKLIEKDRDFSVYEWGTLTIYPLTKKIAKSVSGGG
jgi:hypothetical protein